MSFWIFQGTLNFSGTYADFSQFWEAITRNSQTKPWKIFPWIYAHVTIGNSSKHRVLGTWNFFYRYSKIRKKLKTYIYSKKSRILIFFFFLIYKVFLFVNGLFKVLQCSNPDSMLLKLYQKAKFRLFRNNNLWQLGFQNGKKMKILIFWRFFHFWSLISS